MIKVYSLTCPQCGAALSIEGEHKFCFCQYCGTKIMIDDGTTTHTYRKVDVARIKEAEVEEVIRLKEMEIQEKKRVADEKTKVIKIKASFWLGIVGIIFMVIGFVGGEASGNPDSSIYMFSFLGMFALMAIAFIWLAGNNKE